MSCAYYINKHVPFRVNSGRADKRFIKTSQRRQMNKKKGQHSTTRALFSLWILSQRSRCVSAVSLRAAAPRWWPRAASILRVTHIRVCPRGSSSKEPGAEEAGGPSTVWRGQPYPGEIFTATWFLSVTPRIPQIIRSYSPDPLSEPFCGRGGETSLTTLEVKQASSSLIVDCIAVAVPAPGCHMSPQILVSMSNLADNCIRY